MDTICTLDSSTYSIFPNNALWEIHRHGICVFVCVYMNIYKMK